MCHQKHKLDEAAAEPLAIASSPGIGESRAAASPVRGVAMSPTWAECCRLHRRTAKCDYTAGCPTGHHLSTTAQLRYKQRTKTHFTNLIRQTVPTSTRWSAVPMGR